MTIERLWILWCRLFKKMYLFKVTLSQAVGETPRGGEVTVVPVIGKRLFDEGQVYAFECLTDAYEHTHNEFCVEVKAVDVDQALERSMPSLKAAQENYGKTDKMQELGRNEW